MKLGVRARVETWRMPRIAAGIDEAREIIVGIASSKR